MLTVAEAAVYATVSERLVRTWIADGTLPVLRLGSKGSRGHIRIQREDLDAALASFKVTRNGSEHRTAPARPRHLALKHLSVD